MLELFVGNAPVSWGVYEADDPRNPPFGRVLDAIARAGYRGTELGPHGYLPVDARSLARELEARGLLLASSFVALPLEDPSRRAASVEKALTVARLLRTRGVKELIVADDEHPERARTAGRVRGGAIAWSDREWEAATETLEAVAAALQGELSMRLVVHHHAGTFIETPDEIERLLHATDPERIGLLLDTGHCLYGGGDPVEVYRRHAARIRYVHLKDAEKGELERVRTTDISMQEAWRRGVFCPLGEGAADFSGLVERLRSTGYGGWLIVEQDVVPRADGGLDPDPFEAALKSRAYLRDHLGV